MNIQKQFIKNRSNKKISIFAKIFDNSKGLVFVMHGLGGSKEQEHIKTFGEAFSEKEINTVFFDTTNSYGESEGDYKQATITNYYQDLEDVISWSSNQTWYQEPFYLVGHSIGGFCISYFTQNNPQKVLAIAPISPLVSGKQSEEAYKKYNLEEFTNWQKAGWLIKPSTTLKGVIKELPWSYFEEQLKYDLDIKIEKIKCPILLIVGENDKSTPSEHIEEFYNKLDCIKELHIIKNAPHTFIEKAYLQEIKNIFSNWIDTLSKEV